jgi:hypothetical protein
MWSAVAALLSAFYNAYEARVRKTTIQQTRAALEEQIELQRESARQMALARREALILTDAKSLKIAMPAGNIDLPMLQATWSPEFGLVISGQRLAPPPGNRALQLWLIPKATGAVASLTLRPGPDGEAGCESGGFARRYQGFGNQRRAGWRESASYDHTDLGGCGWCELKPKSRKRRPQTSPQI